MCLVNDNDMAAQGEVEGFSSRLLEQKGVRKGDNLIMRSVSPDDKCVALVSTAELSQGRVQGHRTSLSLMVGREA